MGNEINCQAEFSGQPQTCKALLETTSPNGCVNGVASMRLTLRMEARTSFPPFIHPIGDRPDHLKGQSGLLHWRWIGRSRPYIVCRVSFWIKTTH